MTGSPAERAAEAAARRTVPIRSLAELEVGDLVEWPFSGLVSTVLSVSLPVPAHGRGRERERCSGGLRLADAHYPNGAAYVGLPAGLAKVVE